MIFVTLMHLIANWWLQSVQPVNYSQLRFLQLLNILFNDYLLLCNELESTRRLHQLLLVSSASVNLIGVHWSHGALALDDWIAMTCVSSPSVEIQSFIALRL